MNLFFCNNEGIETRREIKKYIRYYQTSKGKQIAQFESDIISKHMPVNGFLLSIGCGPAVIETRLNEKRKDIYIISIDNDKDMLSVVPFHLHPICADATFLPFVSSSFDIVVCITSLEFIHDPKKVLLQIHRVLKPGGIMLALLLNPKSDFVQQKRNDSTSYIGNHLHNQNYDIIFRFIQQHYGKINTYVVPDEYMKDYSSFQHRLLMMEASK